MSLRPVTRIRRSTYKPVMDTGRARRKRENSFIQIRRYRRESYLFRKRTGGTQLFLHHLLFFSPLEDLPEMMEEIWSDDHTLQMEATTDIRHLLSNPRNPPIEEIINAGVVPRFVEFLTWYDSPRLQLEAAWALTNIASGTARQARALIHHGALPNLVDLVESSSSADVVEQALWALANVAGHSIELKEVVLRHGLVSPLLALLTQYDTTLSLMKTATRALSNLCRGADLEQTKLFLPVIEQLLCFDDEEILMECCWALSELTESSDDNNIEAVMESGICSRLIELLQHRSSDVVVPALRAVGNIISGDDIQIMIDCEVLPSLLTLLKSDHEKNIKKEACWTISNVTAGNREQIQAVIEEDIIPVLIEIFQTSVFDIQKEAAWAISNATTNASVEQIRYLVGEGCIKPLCDMLDCHDSGTVKVCLDGINNILIAEEAEEREGEVNGYVRCVRDA